ncbi:hypothetical protein RYX36_010152 [Vicia faba]
MHVQLRRERRRTNTQDIELAMDMIVVFSDEDDRNTYIVIIERLAKKLELHSVKDLELTGSEKSYANKVSALEKSLVDEVSKTKTLTQSCEDLQAFESKLSKELDMAEKSCADLQQSLERSRMDMLNAGDVAFDQEKDQVMCLYLTLNISSVDFFKSILDGKLVDMEDVNGSPVTNGPDGNDASPTEVTK